MAEVEIKYWIMILGLILVLSLAVINYLPKESFGSVDKWCETYTLTEGEYYFLRDTYDKIPKKPLTQTEKEFMIKVYEADKKRYEEIC